MSEFESLLGSYQKRINQTLEGLLPSDDSILSEAITLSGWRIIQESALCANRHMNKVIRGETELKL